MQTFGLEALCSSPSTECESTPHSRLYKCFIIGPGRLGCETNLQEVTGWESSYIFRFDPGHFLQGQTSVAKLKSAYNSLIGPRVLGCETNQQEIMGWESSDVVKFDFWLPLQGYMSVARTYNSLIPALRCLGCESIL